MKLRQNREVYEGGEDSEMLGDAVEKYALGKVLDVGCGNGIQSIIAANKKEVTSVWGVDINKEAVKSSEENAKLNSVEKKTKFIASNLFEKIGGKFDTIIFNPPYLPTKKEEKLKGNINLAFDGGESGNKIINKFLAEFAKHLERGGILLMVLSSLNKHEKIINKLKKADFNVQIVGRKKFFFEELVVLKAQREG